MTPELDDLLSKYWDLAYAEGAARAEYDTAYGDGQIVWMAIRNEVKRLVEAGQANPPVGWEPIEKAPENKEIWCYCGAYEPHYFVARFKWESKYEEVLVSERGNRRTYETRETKERDWSGSESYGAEFWMLLPPRPVKDKE